MRALPTAYIGFSLCILIGMLSLGGAPVFGDPDTAWHLAAGDLIRSQHAIPLNDPWSFTATDERWYNLSWLFDVGLSMLFSWGGFSAIYVLTIGVFCASLTYMAHLCIKQGASFHVVLLLIPLAILTLFGGITARPNMCSIVMTLAFYSLLHRYHTTQRWRWLVALPPLMMLWANLHGGFLTAFLLLGLFLFEAAVQYDRKRLRAYGLMIALCLGATLINPYGFAIYYGAYKTLSATFDQGYISEWRPIEIGHNLPATLLLLMILIVSNAFDKRISLVDRMLAIIMLMLSLSGVRYIIITILLLIPYISKRLTYVLYESPYGKHLKEIDNTVLDLMRTSAMRTAGALLAVAALVFIATPYPRDKLLLAPVGFPKQNFPEAEAAFIEKNYPSLHFFNDYNIGGYLDYLWHGRVKVFVDGRSSSVYSKDVLADFITYGQTSGMYGPGEVIGRQYQINGAIIPNNSQAAKIWETNSQWKSVYKGAVATVYIKKDAPTAAH